MNLESMFTSMNEEMSNPEAFEQSKGGEKFKADERFYKISKSKDGNGSVKIRFLPSYNTDKNKLNTFVTRQVHAPTQYKTIGGEKKKRFISEVCPKTAGGKDAECPICDYAWDNYNRLIDSDEKAAKQFPKTFASKAKYITNIQIIEDSENPENNGKVFLFEYGDQIQKLIKKQSQPTAEEISEKGLKPFNAWDLLNGKDFRLKLKDGKFTDNGYPSWEESFFVTDASKHVEDMSGVEKVLAEAYCLDEFIDMTHIKSIETIQKSLDYVLFKDPEKKPKSESKEEKTSKESALSETESIDDTPTFEMDEPKQETPKVESKEVSAPASEMDDFFAQFS